MDITPVQTAIPRIQITRQGSPIQLPPIAKSENSKQTLRNQPKNEVYTPKHFMLYKQRIRCLKKLKKVYKTIKPNVERIKKKRGRIEKLPRSRLNPKSWGTLSPRFVKN